MSEEPEITTFDLTCNDGTVFTLPSNHPEINIGGIGGVSYNAIMEDPAAIPAEFEQYCTFRPEPPAKITTESERPRIGKFAMAIINEQLRKWISGWKGKP